MSPGKKFRAALKAESPLQLIGTVNAYLALMAKNAGFKAIYLSGAGVANSSFGIPDIGLITLDNLVADIDRITSACDLPLIADMDTGFGKPDMIKRAIHAIEKAQAAGVHIEDQDIQNKRCGHLEGKVLVSQKEMGERLKAAIDARGDPDFFIIARTDALAVEGFKKTVERIQYYEEMGVDAIFAEAFTSLKQYSALKKKIRIPILANQTEFGKTPLYSLKELEQAGVDIVLYPLSLTRIMYQAADDLLKVIRIKGTQKNLLKKMQTRQELYRLLGYEEYQAK